MKVSIIIPIFNCAKYLERSIPAILSQTHKNFELILVNDGSTDNSLEICQKFAETDSRIHIINKTVSEGAGPARNSGIDIAEGLYMMFIDSDDWIEYNMVEKLLEAITREQCHVAICGYETYVEGESCRDTFKLQAGVFQEDGMKRLFAQNFPEGIVGYLWNKIYDSSVIKKNNIRFPNMRRLQDGVFNINFFAVAKRCCIIEDVLYRYRLNAQTDMFRKLPKNYFDLIRQFSKTFTETKQMWGDFSNRKIAEFFLNETGSCLENVFSKHWEMSKKERICYLQKIADDEVFLQMAGERVSLPKYRSFLIYALKKRKFYSIGILVKIKTFIKQHFSKIFYVVKRNGK